MKSKKEEMRVVQFRVDDHKMLSVDSKKGLKGRVYEVEQGFSTEVLPQVDEMKKGDRLEFCGNVKIGLTEGEAVAVVKSLIEFLKADREEKEAQ